LSKRLAAITSWGGGDEFVVLPSWLARGRGYWKTGKDGQLEIGAPKEGDEREVGEGEVWVGPRRKRKNK